MNQQEIDFTKIQVPRLSRREHQVFSCLVEAARRGEEFFPGYPGKVPPHIFTNPGCGGGEGKRRLRELRRKLNLVGLDIDWDFVKINGEKTTNTVYWLVIPEEKQFVVFLLLGQSP